eukprot:scaffold2911_cov414-Prasinococcus_capsulatus_cf.AAC.18
MRDTEDKVNQALIGYRYFLVYRISGPLDCTVGTRLVSIVWHPASVFRGKLHGCITVQEQPT